APRRMSAMARPSRSAGLLPYLEDPDGLHVFLGHMGGPFWARKEVGSWSIIKGIYNPETEDAQDAARREFREEIGVDPPSAEEIPLGQLRASGKLITVYAVAGDRSLAYRSSNPVSIQWPPR